MKILALLCICFVAAVNGLTCDQNSLKVTIQDKEYVLDDYEKYEMQATIAYSLMKYCGGELELDCAYIPTAEDIKLENETQRIAVCVYVDRFTPSVVRNAIRLSKANLNGALLLTDDELYVDGILPTLEPMYEPEFPYWLIAYIVIFGLVILGGLAILVYSKFYSGGENGEDKKAMLDDEASDSSSDYSVQGNSNNVYEVVEDEGAGTML